MKTNNVIIANYPECYKLNKRVCDFYMRSISKINFPSFLLRSILPSFLSVTFAAAWCASAGIIDTILSILKVQFMRNHRGTCIWPSAYPYRREIRTLGPAEALNSRKLRFVAWTVNCPTFFVIYFLYGWKVDDFSWTDPLMHNFLYSRGIDDEEYLEDTRINRRRSAKKRESHV